MAATPAEPISAATLVLLRQAADGGMPELLVVERSPAMAFAGGATVFPGGRVDPADLAFALELGAADPDDAAARIAAIRETIEETGVAIGLHPLPGPAPLAAIRAALATGMPFAQALAGSGSTLDLSRLDAFARWRPAHSGMRIYDTRFYLARWSRGAGEATVDGTENVRLRWAAAATILADADAGRATLIYPTRRTLERLATYPDHDAAVADARAFPIRTITPTIQDRNGVAHLCIPDDLGYPVTAEPLESVRRG